MLECAKWLFSKALRVSIPVEKANQTRAIHLRVAANAGNHLIRLLRVMSKPVVASYCTTFLKPEMMHIYRQVTGLKRVDTFVVCRERRCAEKFPFSDLHKVDRVKVNFVRRFLLKYVKKEPPVVYRGEYDALAKILDRKQADLLHIYFGHTGVHLLPFLRRWPRPTVCSFHGMDVQPRENQPGYLDRMRELLEELPLVMARSESLKERLIALGCDPGKIRLNRTGIPMEKFSKVERTRPENGRWHFVQACRLIEKKGLDVSLKAFADFVAKGNDARFTIAGEGPLEQEIKILSRELGVEERIDFVGFLSELELADLFRRAHIFFHPSQLTPDKNQEGVPNSMLEAMATGLPVLGTVHGGIPEAVTDGSSGILVPERDHQALACAVNRMVQEEGAWETMALQAAEDVRKSFGKEEQLAKLEDVYFEALEKGKDQ